MSARNGSLSRFTNGRVRFLSDYQIINILDDDLPSPATDTLTSSVDLQGQRKKLERCDSVGKEYVRLASTVIEYKDELQCATMKNDLDGCKELIENGADVDNTDSRFGMSALHVAARMNYINILSFLLSEGADINLRSTSLHIAIRQRSDDCCHELLNSPDVNIHIEDNVVTNKCSALHLASKIGNYDICQKILESNASSSTINRKDKDKRTPLHEAAVRGFKEVVTLFLNHNADWDVKDRKSYYPIHLAAQNGHGDCCIALLDVENDLQPRRLTKDGSTALMLAAKSGNYKCCEILRDYCDINAQNSSKDTALHYAALRGYCSTVEKLIEWGAEVFKNSKGNTPIHESAGQKNISCLRILAEKVAFQDPGQNKIQQNVLHIAVQKLSVESLRYLLDKESFRAKVNEVDHKNKTPLLHAVRKGHSESAQILLENGADPLIRDLDKNLPLHIAAAKNLKLICRLLIKDVNRRSVNYTNKEGATPLHLAAFKDARDCCQLLIDKGFAIDSRDKYGNAPIHIAAKSGNANTLGFFIKKGVALTHTVESTGDSALHLASSEGHMECCKLLVKSARKSIDILNKMNKSPLDAAIESKRDHIFEYLLMRRSDLDYNKEKIVFQMGLHSYMHLALKNKREIILRALVQSSMWLVCFNSDLCEDDVCSNFNCLIVSYPDFAKIVFDKCTTKDKKFNFEFFDAPLFINAKADKQSSKYPFDRETGKLLESAKVRENCCCLAEHPLRKAIDSEHLKLLLHPLTNAYLKYKWSSYIMTIVFCLLLFELLSVIVFSINIGFSWNLSHLNATDATEEEIWDTIENAPLLDEGRLKRNIISFIQMLFLMLHIILELKFVAEMKKAYFITTPWETLCKILRILGLFIFCIPIYVCSFDLGIKMTCQWQFGIVTLLICWSLFIHKLNQLPVISVFMPVTRKFLTSFAKVILYIFLILFIFSYIFYLLLDNESAFDDIPSAFIKSVVWMLGDLNYDAIFVDNESNIRYPYMTNTIFLFFVTSITFFIINMVITNPSDHFEVFRNKATIHKASNRIMLFLKLDSVFVETRRKFTRSFWTESEASISEAKVILNFIDQIDSESIESEQDKLRRDVGVLNRKVECLIQDNTKFLSILADMAKLKENEQEKARKDFEAMNEKLDSMLTKINAI